MKTTLTTLALSACLLGYTTAEPNQDKKKPTPQKVKEAAKPAPKKSKEASKKKSKAAPKKPKEANNKKTKPDLFDCFFKNGKKIKGKCKISEKGFS